MNKLGRVQPSASCVRVRRDSRIYFGEFSCAVCDMSHDLACVDSCPADALELDEKTGVVRFKAEECTSCLACVEACPNVAYDGVSGQIMICDLCEGDPLCVQWCPEGALTWGAAR
jgi:carbon-monoxide dehydrogenase iron sulfur subunit